MTNDEYLKELASRGDGSLQAWFDAEHEDSTRSAKRAAAVERVRKAKDAGTSIGYAIVGREYYPWEAYETLIELLTDDGGLTNLEWLFIDSEQFRQAVSAFAFAHANECPASPAQMVDWLMAPHVDANDAFSPESDVMAGDVDASDANATQDSREKLEADVTTYLMDKVDKVATWSATRYELKNEILRWLDRQATITANETSHDNPYVGLVRGKQWERTETSDYYCGRCGWKVTDHDSYCPECGGALHKASSKPDSKFDARKTAETPETDAAKGDIRDFADSREKLEADVRKHYAYSTTTLMYPPSANKTTDMLSALPVDTVIGWLDRQAEITRHEICDRWAEHLHPIEQRCADLREQVDRLTAERDEAVEAYDAHMAAHDAWHEAEDIKYTRNRFTVLEQAKNERIAALEAERDYWRGQVERCVAAAVKPERHAEGVMAYPRDELRFAEPSLLVVDAIDSLRDFHAEDRIANKRLNAECDALARDLEESEKLRDELAKRDKGIARLKRQRDEARQELEKHRWEYCETCEHAEQVERLEAERYEHEDAMEKLMMHRDELRDKVDRLEAERDELQAKVHDLQIVVDCVNERNVRYCELESERDNLAADLRDCEKQRERLRQALGIAIDHAHEVVSLVNLDGEVIG